MENILVIDDDEKILELVQEVLKNEHYIVETRSYVDNTNIGEFEGFDLILLDIMRSEKRLERHGIAAQS